MDLDRWTDLDLAYLLIFGEHPDLEHLDEETAPRHRGSRPPFDMDYDI